MFSLMHFLLSCSLKVGVEISEDLSIFVCLFVLEGVVCLFVFVFGKYFGNCPLPLMRFLKLP